MMMKIFLVIPFAFATIFRNIATTANPSQDDCRDVTFKQPITDKALAGYVIANQTVDSKQMCDALCYMEANCVSTNFDTAPGAKDNCELNSQDDKQRPAYLNKKPGVIFQAMKNFCHNQTACTYKNNTGCQSGYGSRGYRCACAKCFRGKYCETVVNHQDIVMQFPTKSINHRVEIQDPFPALSAFTLAMWIQIDPAAFTHVPFSYSTRTLPDELVVFIHKTSVQIKFKNIKKLTVNYLFNSLDPNQWVHLCFSWRNIDGVMKGYINGTKYATSHAVFIGSPLPQGGLMLGQEQDAYMGGLAGNQALKGNLTSVNLWNHTLSDSEVADLARACPATRQGNALKWSEMFQYKTDSVDYFCGTHCRP